MKLIVEANNKNKNKSENSISLKPNFSNILNCSWIKGFLDHIICCIIKLYKNKKLIQNRDLL